MSEYIKEFIKHYLPHQTAYKDLVLSDYDRQSVNVWWGGKVRRSYRLNHFRHLYGYSGEANHWIYVHFFEGYKNASESNNFAYLSLENDGILVVNVFEVHESKANTYEFTGKCKFIPADQITSFNINKSLLGLKKECTLTFNGHTKRFILKGGYLAGPNRTFTREDSFTSGVIKQFHDYINHDYPADTYQKRIQIQRQATEKYTVQQVVRDCISHPEGPLSSLKNFWTFRVCYVDSRTGLLWNVIFALVFISVVVEAFTYSIFRLDSLIGWLVIFYGALCLEVIRRLNDVGWKYPVVIAMLIPGANIILLLILLFKPSIHRSSDEVKQIINTSNKP